MLKPILSVLVGFIISFFAFILFIMMAFTTIREILWVLLIVTYIALILIIIFFNLNKKKLMLILSGVPVLCIILGIIFIRHSLYIQSIPTVNEPANLLNDYHFLYKYEPAKDNSFLAKLDKEPSIKLTDNLPVLDGATALYPVYASFVNAVYSHGNYDLWNNDFLLCNKTDGAYEKLLNGEVDIIFCAPPSDYQIKQFIEKNIEVELVPIGKEAFVFFVNKENPVSNLSIENIQKIYSGKIKNWKHLGGNNKRILAFQRPNNSGSQTALIHIMGNVPLAKARRENMHHGMGGIINEVASYRNFGNAIGYSFLFFATEMVKNDQIKLLSIEGIYPSRETIQDGTYPFSDNFYAIYNRENKNENIKIFIDWILSEEGQYLIDKTGYVSLIR